MAFLKKAIKILSRTLLVILLLLLSLYGLLHLSSVQTWLAQKYAANLSEKLHTKVSIGKVKFHFFDHVEFESLLIEDQQHDTLLYAGSGNADLNDWFFLESSIEVKNINFDHAVVKLKRDTKRWNYQFLNDYLSGNQDIGSSKHPTINLQKIHLKNVRFQSLDRWKGEDMICGITAAELEFQQTNFHDNELQLSKVILDQPRFNMISYKGTRSEAEAKIALADTTTWKNNINCKLELLSINNGSFSYKQSNHASARNAPFNENNFQFDQIQGTFSKMDIKGNELKANLMLSTNEKSGFQIKKLSANVIFNENEMNFHHLNLITPLSNISGYYSMKYKDFQPDMNDFIEKIDLEGNFKSSLIHSDDIAFFAPELKDWHRLFHFNGNAKGRINDFNVDSLQLTSGQTSVKGNIGFRKIPDVDNMVIFFNSEETKTNYDELTSFVPNLHDSNTEIMRKFGDMTFQGNFSGTLRKFIAYGNINSGLGNISTDIKIELPNGGIPQYEGHIKTTKFSLGNALDNSQMGAIALDGQISGKGFDLNNINTKFNGKISNIDYKNYSYKNINIDGSFSKNTFSGKLDVDDPHLKLSNCEGRVHIDGNILDCNLKGNLFKANMNELGWIKRKATISGDFNLNFKGSAIDNFTGKAYILNSKIETESRQLPVAEIDIDADQSGAQKFLILNTDILQARIEGDYKIRELPDAFRSFLSNYFPTYITKNNNTLSKQNFNFDIRTGNIEPYMQMFEPRIYGTNHAHISGNIKLPENLLTVNADIPYLSFDGKTFKNSIISSKGNRDTLSTMATFDDIIYNDSLHFPQTAIEFLTSNDITDLHIKTSNESTLTSADLNATLNTATAGLGIHFMPSSFILNNKKWDIQSGGIINWKKDNLNIDSLIISHELQKITFTSEPDDVTNNINLTANFENINLADFLPYAFKEPKMRGKFNGKAKITEPLSTLKVTYEGRADSLYAENELIGNININGNADWQSGLITYRAINADTTNAFTFEGQYLINDSANNNLNAIFTGEKINLKILRPYLADVFDQIDGTAVGKLQLSNDKNGQYLTGEMTLMNTSLKVLHTQCRYTINGQKIQLSKNKIEFPYVKLLDTLGNTATLFGSIQHDFFNKFYFNNLRLETPRLAILNTISKDNSAFYGKILGRAKMNLNGPLSNLYMNVDGEPMTQDSSYVYINTSDQKESNALDYIEFEKYGIEQTAIQSVSSNNFILNVNVASNPSCNVFVTLDEETNDVIKAQGTGNLSVTIGNLEPLSIRGKYDIKKGEYTFKFQTFLDRPFTLNSGSIIWNGNPYNAVIDINAQYAAKNVDLSTLSSRAGYQKQEITINSKLTGILQNPNVKFDILLPEKSDARRDDIIVKRLADFKNDDNEMNKQVASLLLFNTFISSSQNFLSQGNASNLISNTIGGVMSSLLTTFFNKELEKATKGILSTYIDINPTLDLQKNTSQLQANIRAGLKILLDNRLIMQVGGNLDYNNPTYLQQLEKKGLLTPDITIEWLINKEGTLRVVGFNRSSVDFTFNQRNRSGLQLSYRKDMNHIGDLLKSKEKINQEVEKETEQLDE